MHGQPAGNPLSPSGLKRENRTPWTPSTGCAVHSFSENGCGPPWMAFPRSVAGIVARRPSSSNVPPAMRLANRPIVAPNERPFPV